MTFLVQIYWKDQKIKGNARFFFILKSAKKVQYISTVNY